MASFSLILGTQTSVPTSFNRNVTSIATSVLRTDGNIGIVGAGDLKVQAYRTLRGSYAVVG